jgi:hypothetical protein
MTGTISLLLALWGGTPARAAEGVSVTLVEEAHQYGLSDEDVSAAIGGADVLHLGDPDAYLRSMADASALATKGMGVDYASNFEKFTFGWSVGSGVSGDGVHLGRGGGEIPKYGFSLQMCGTAGLNLGVLSGGKGFLSHIVLFGHGLAMNTGGQTFDAALTNYGAHLQVRLVKPKEDAEFAWGGLAITAGYEHAAYRLDLVQAMPVSAPAGGLELTWDATGTYVLQADSDSIPVELSTNLRVVFLTVFVGAGMDFNTGTARAAMELTGPLTAEVDGTSTNLGSATVSFLHDGVPGPSFPRAFGGAQINLFVVKLYGQVNLGLDEGFGAHAGMRIAL